jgi:Fe-S-cluster-containing hydrogenase component 2
MSERVPAHIDEGRCCGCTQCRLVCPAGAIISQTARCRVNETQCTGCGKCMGVCPLRCIRCPDPAD